jgi:hypothetical protein
MATFAETLLAEYEALLQTSVGLAVATRQVSHAPGFSRVVTRRPQCRHSRRRTIRPSRAGRV